MKSRWIAVMLGLALVAAATVAAPAASEPQAAAESFDFWADLWLASTSAPCPADAAPNTTECRALTVHGALGVRDDPFRELGRVSESTYTSPLGLGPPTCPAGFGKSLATTGRLIVAEKGEIAFALSEGARCVGYGSAWEEQQEFTITGGTGPFAGASGSGTLLRYWGDPVWGDGEVWTGTLLAPGTLTASGSPTAPEIHQVPKLSGAVAKTVRAAKGAKSARVTFKVTATDDGGGDLPVSCWPRSGSRFPLGKSLVLCAATDATGNTATRTFTVTVRPRR